MLMEVEDGGEWLRIVEGNSLGEVEGVRGWFT
jgi:hypothetical protein